MSGGVSAARWVAGRTPAAPPKLAERLTALLGDGDAAAADPAAVAEACVDGAAALLTDLLSSGCTTRDAALDLLTADALATYAFEAAGDAPERLGELAHRAMVRLSAIGEAGA